MCLNIHKVKALLPSGGKGMKERTSLSNRAYELEKDIIRLFGGVPLLDTVRGNHKEDNQ